MELVQARLVTDDVERLAAFYARLVQAEVVLNEYYVEVPAGAASIGFSRQQFTERLDRRPAALAAGGTQTRRDELILDFLSADVDSEHQRIAALGVDWVMPVTTQPWGNRSMIFADPRGNLVNVFSRPSAI